MARFALIGAGGYIAPRHMKAVKTTGGELVVALDPSDSVGLMDSYFPDADFFVEFERFDRHVDKLRRQSRPVDYVSICSPNYLHDAHCRFAMRSDADAICEKPLVLNPWNLDGLAEIERETGRQISTILQLRIHPEIQALKARVEASGRTDHEVVLTYVTSRGQLVSRVVERRRRQVWRRGNEHRDSFLRHAGVRVRADREAVPATERFEQGRRHDLLSEGQCAMVPVHRPCRSPRRPQGRADDLPFRSRRWPGDRVLGWIRRPSYQACYQEILAGQAASVSTSFARRSRSHQKSAPYPLRTHGAARSSFSDAGECNSRNDIYGGRPSSADRRPAPDPGVLVHRTSIVDDGSTHWPGHKNLALQPHTCGTGDRRGILYRTELHDRAERENWCGRKIQNNVSLYEGVELGESVFCGPSCVFTNVRNPRAHVSRKSEFMPTKVGTGVTIGANATIVCGHSMGDYAFVGAGAVVTKDVPPFALIIGNPGSSDRMGQPGRGAAGIIARLPENKRALPHQCGGQA